MVVHTNSTWRSEQVHVERRAIVTIDSIHESRVLLKTGTLTTPERIIVRAPRSTSPRWPDSTVSASNKRREISNSPMAVEGILRTEEMVHERLFIIVDIIRIRAHRPEFFGQLEHVVRVAVLASISCEKAGDGVRCMEMLRLTVAADGVGMSLSYDIPSIRNDVMIRGCTSGFVFTARTNPFGDLRIRMQPVELVLI